MLEEIILQPDDLLAMAMIWIAVETATPEII
jgi:hypothetical protein